VKNLISAVWSEENMEKMLLIFVSIIPVSSRPNFGHIQTFIPPGRFSLNSSFST